MTISSTVRIAGPFTGNGVTTTFPFTYKVFSTADVQVIRLTISTGIETTLTLVTDYNITLNGDQDSNPGGNIVLVAALSALYKLTATSDIANLQPTDLTNQGGFYPEVITDALDRATIQIQQISDINDRTLKIPISDGALNMELPTAASRANSFLAFGATGLPTVVTAGSSGAPTTMTRQNFSGTGSQVAFTLASDPGALGNSAEVFIGGVYQNRTTYTISGLTLTFSAAPVAGTDNIEFVNFLTDAIGSTSADLVTYTPAGTGAVARSAQAKMRDTVSVKDFGAVGDGVTDDTSAVQTAINYCLANNLDLSVPTLTKISQVNINRLVDAVTNEFYFTIYSNNGGGFITSTATTMFTTSLAFATTPQSHLVRWKNIKFVGENIATASYVIDGKKFLRIQFNDCSFYKIKLSSITGAGQYYQSYALNNCFAQGWSGSFMKAALAGVSDGAYDIQIIGGLYQAGGGQHCFDIERVNNGKFWTTIINCTGTAIKINGPKGVDISGYFETNALDIDFSTGGIPAVGVNIHGSIFYVSATSLPYTIKWGTAFGCTSRGNVHYGNMHNLQSDSQVDINDHAYENLSSTFDAVNNAGYRETSYTLLNLRGGTSASYTSSPVNGRYTKIGKRVELEFIATLTSTAINPADTLYINSGLPFAATSSSFLCGTVEVVGSTTNNGISPLFLLTTTTINSSINVIPANIVANSWTVKIKLSYVVA